MIFWSRRFRDSLAAVVVVMHLMMDAQTALSLVASFFPLEWRIKPTEVDVRPILGGFVNRLYLVSRTTRADREPSRVLIRLFGLGPGLEEPPVTSSTLSATEQAVMYYEMGRRGWGPRLYGVFRGGRLEEWIDSRTLRADEATLLCKDMAKSLARFHSLILPLRRTTFGSVVEELKAACEANKDHPWFTETDWPAELDWVASLFTRYKCKASLALMDANYLNVLVRNDAEVVLIDYETATYAYRGIDMGGFFTARMYDWNANGSKLTGCALPSPEEERSFCEAYKEELGEDDVDVDQLLVEAKIGQLYQILFSVFMCGELKALEEDLLDALGHMLESYKRLKAGWQGNTEWTQRG
ncbi:kinase-like domain-containing protein [Kockovaella imperatae]|uniref:Kinase-like domain-containing protein n=1 Tax=Kockovaella imperatae TaxID=4999 RepID=A0A1Y1UCU5_9TREE|nr:kinase-like domain-containing protein [Kockovaella imperatae]ORX35870.1 kinase-like domain-containing protein [Kockovaella imperatae]